MARRHRVYRQIEGKKRYEHRAKAIVSAAIFVLVLAFPISVFQARNPTSIDEPASMDVAQVARNLARGGGFTTNIIRPDLYASPPRYTKPPDIVNPPLHIWLLAWLPGMKRGTILASPDGTVANFSSFCYLLTALFLFILERRMSGSRTFAVASLIYLFTVPLLHGAVSGSGETLAAAMVTLLFMMTFVDRNQSFLYSFLLGAVLGACYLTSYVYLALLIPLIASKAMRGGEGMPRHLAATLLGTAVVSVPWMVRNLHFGGNALIAQPFSAVLLGGSELGRSELHLHFLGFYGKVISHFRGVCAVAFFLISPLVRSGNQEAQRAKVFLWFAVGVVFVFSMLGKGDVTALGAFLPGAILIGSATFGELIPRQGGDVSQLRSRLTALFIVLNLMPFAVSVLAPAGQARTFHEERVRTMADMHGMMHTGEIVMTNAAESLAYYGEFNTLPLPHSGNELRKWEKVFGQLRFAALCPYGELDDTAKMILRQRVVPEWFISHRAHVYPGGELFFIGAEADADIAGFN